MTKVGRNEPCPCGSGKKYKKCCEGVAATSAKTLATVDALGQSHHFVDDGLDDLSNSVIDLIDSGKLDEALTVCQRLRTEFPEVIDGLERSAMVHEARGDLELAMSFFRRALAFTQQPGEQEGFDEELREDFRQKIAALESRTRRPPT